MFLVRNYFERNETEFFRVFFTFIMSEKEIGDYFSMLFARVAVGLFFGGNIQGSLVDFCQKESPREIQMCKLVQISRQKS